MIYGTNPTQSKLLAENRWCKSLKKWWPGTESNCRHGDFQSPALPTELPGHIFALRVRIRKHRGELVKYFPLFPDNYLVAFDRL